MIRKHVAIRRWKRLEELQLPGDVLELAEARLHSHTFSGAWFAASWPGGSPASLQAPRGSGLPGSVS